MGQPEIGAGLDAKGCMIFTIGIKGRFLFPGSLCRTDRKSGQCQSGR